MIEQSSRCPTCQVIYAKRNPPEDPPCHQCRVDLMPENEEAANVYMLCKFQVVTAGMGEVIDINHLAVWEAIDRYKVKDQIRCFELVNTVFHYMLNKGRNNEAGKLEP
jgi:hypothetical protein